MKKFPISLARSKIMSGAYVCKRFSRYSHSSYPDQPQRPSPRMVDCLATTEDGKPTFKLLDKMGIEFQIWEPL